MNTFSIDKFLDIKSFRARIDYCNQHLRKIGNGSSRTVYKFEGYALKVAKNKKGIEQNLQESETPFEEYNIFSKIVDCDKEGGLFLKSELADKAKKKDFKTILGISFLELRDFILCVFKEYCDSENLIRANYQATDEALYKKFINEEICQGELFDFLSELYEYMQTYFPSFYEISDFWVVSNWGIVGRENRLQIIIIDTGISREIFENHYKWDRNR